MIRTSTASSATDPTQRLVRAPMRLVDDLLDVTRGDRLRPQRRQTSIEGGRLLRGLVKPIEIDDVERLLEQFSDLRSRRT